MTVCVDRILVSAIEWQTDQKAFNSSGATIGSGDKQSTTIPAWWFNAPVEEFDIPLLRFGREALGRDGTDLVHQFRPILVRVVLATAFGDDCLLSTTVVCLSPDPFIIVPCPSDLGEVD